MKTKIKKEDKGFIVTPGDKPEEKANITKKLLIPPATFLCLRVCFLRPHTIPLHLYVAKIFLRSIPIYLTLDILMVIQQIHSAGMRANMNFITKQLQDLYIRWHDYKFHVFPEVLSCSMGYKDSIYFSQELHFKRNGDIVF